MAFFELCVSSVLTQNPGGGALECSLLGGAHFLRVYTTCLGKKFAF